MVVLVIILVLGFGQNVLCAQNCVKTEPPELAHKVEYVLDVLSGEMVPVEYGDTTSEQSDPYSRLASYIIMTERIQGDDGKYGFRNEIKGKTVEIPCKYDYAYDFVGGFARVKLNGKWGFIDEWGTIVVPIEYDEVKDFSMGFASVKLNTNWYYVDLNGKCLQFSATDMRGNPVELSQPDYNLMRSIELFRDKDSRYAHPLEDKKDIVVKVEISVDANCKMTNCKVTSTSEWVKDVALQLINDFDEYMWKEHIGSTRMYKGWPYTIDRYSNNQQINVPYKIVFPLTLRSSYFYDRKRKN